MDILKSQMKDAQEEIKELRENNHKSVYLKLASLSTAIQLGANIAWDVNTVLRSSSDFEIAADGVNITMLTEGVYEIKASVVTTTTSNGAPSLQLKLNGNVIASTYFASNTGYHCSLDRNCKTRCT